MRNIKLVAVLVAALCVTLALGGGVASAHKASGNSYVCAFGKKVPHANVGKIYIALGVKPKAYGKTFCHSFNSTFKGTAANVNSQLGDGHTYCRYKYVKPTVTVVLLAFADKAVAGQAFCKNYHPKGWKSF